ncbi:hypothetical protein [Labrys wisconsinensis]|uniref:Uncharacterized protein n=1 Tax=Labrys wisconsinensis TaxID=425677 RepID=A0ABU0JLS7_9HYPH|nr:hypothetical protein [Labrys wisconsinensis]MDQ0475252.1 hypothetical protein [Labrys wisconsinensis]
MIAGYIADSSITLRDREVSLITTTFAAYPDGVAMTLTTIHFGSYLVALSWEDMAKLEEFLRAARTHPDVVAKVGA